MNKESGKLFFYLILIEVIRILFTRTFEMVGGGNNIYFIKLLVIVLMTGFLIIWSRRDQVSLSLFFTSDNTFFIMCYSLFSVVVIFIIMTSPMFGEGFNSEKFIPYIYGIIGVPVFEELLFRGYFWNTIKSNKDRPWKPMIITGILFVLWKVINITEFNYFFYTTNIVGKYVTGVTIVSAMAVILGAIRKKFNNTFSCILCHSAINMLMRIIL